jgi:uncharacterized membrane protein
METTISKVLPVSDLEAGILATTVIHMLMTEKVDLTEYMTQEEAEKYADIMETLLDHDQIRLVDVQEQVIHSLINKLFVQLKIR